MQCSCLTQHIVIAIVFCFGQLREVTTWSNNMMEGRSTKKWRNDAWCKMIHKSFWISPSVSIQGYLKLFHKRLSLTICPLNSIQLRRFASLMKTYLFYKRPPWMYRPVLCSSSTPQAMWLIRSCNASWWKGEILKFEKEEGLRDWSGPKWWRNWSRLHVAEAEEW